MISSNSIHPNQHNIFDNPIWGFILNEQHYQAIDYIDYILKMKEKTPTLHKSNLGGWHSPCNLHEHGIFKELVYEILNIAKDVTKPYSNKELEIVEMWAMVNNKYHTNASHVHEGIVSGVFYLQVPENSGRLIMVNSAVRSQNHPIRNNNFPVEPDGLALIMFPSWMEHYVEQSQSDEDRIAISFNIGEK